MATVRSARWLVQHVSNNVRRCKPHLQAKCSVKLQLLVLSDRPAASVANLQPVMCAPSAVAPARLNQQTVSWHKTQRTPHGQRTMPSLDASQLDALKYALIAIVGVATFAASWLPFYIAAHLSSERATRWIATASAASAGVVVGAFLCHLLPDAAAAFLVFLASEYGAGRIVDYPFAQTICGCVLASLVVLDGMVVRRGLGGDHHGGHDGGSGSHDHITDSLRKLKQAAAASLHRGGDLGSSYGALDCQNNGHAPSVPSGSRTSVADGYSSSSRRDGTCATAASQLPSGSTERHLEPFEVDVTAARGAGASGVQAASTAAGTAGANGVVVSNGSAAPAPRRRASVERPLAGPSSHRADDQGHHEHHQQLLGERDASLTASALQHHGAGASRRLLLRAWVFFAALSVHGIFDGLSVGSETDAGGFTSTTIAVVSHKLFDGLSLGCALYPAGLPLSQRLVLLLFCAATTPLGIGIGMAATSAVDGAHVQLVNGIVLGMASGSFAYISLMELLPSSLADGQWVPLKLTVFVAGFGAMAVLAAYV
jgi:zinc transporter ZupT